MKNIFIVISSIMLCKSLYSQNYYEMGIVEYYKEEDEKAIELFSKAIQNNQELVNSYMYRGASKTMLNKYVDAFSDIGNSIKLDSNNYKAYYYYGRIYLFQGFTSLALKYFDKALTKNKNDGDVYDNIAICKTLIGNYQESINYEDIAIGLNPKCERYYIQKGFAQSNLKKYKEAIMNYDISINIKPTQKAYANKGFALSQLGLHKEAIEFYTKALLIIPEDKEVLYLRGMSYKSIGNNSSACDDFTQSVNLGSLIAISEKKDNCLQK